MVNAKGESKEALWTAGALSLAAAEFRNPQASAGRRAGGILEGLEDRTR